MTDQLDVKKCVDELIQRLNVPDELYSYGESEVGRLASMLEGGAS